MAVVIEVNGSGNGQSVSGTVYEDTDGDGTADNTDTFSGYASQRLDALSGGAGNDYWIDFDLSTSDITATPTVTSVTLDTEREKAGELTTDVTLNGQSITATVYEDTDGDGTADNSETVDLTDGVTTYDLYLIEGGAGNDYWINFDLDTEAITATPQINSTTLDTTLWATDAGSVTTAGMIW